MSMYKKVVVEFEYTQFLEQSLKGIANLLPVIVMLHYIWEV